MKVTIDLGKYKSNSELLSGVTSAFDGTARDLDHLFELILASKGEIDYVFINKSELAEDLLVYFGMLSMTIEEASEVRSGISINTFYFEEE